MKYWLLTNLIYDWPDRELGRVLAGGLYDGRDIFTYVLIARYIYLFFIYLW